jgi:hypothetical protein
MLRVQNEDSMWFTWPTVALLLAVIAEMVSSPEAAKTPSVLKADLPHIACEVCKQVVQTLVSQVELRRSEAPYNKVRTYLTAVRLSECT